MAHFYFVRSRYRTGTWEAEETFKLFETKSKTYGDMLHLNFRTDYDHYHGCPLAPIELVEYGDFQCDYCAEVYPVIKWLQDSFGDRLKFVYRHFPIPTRHPLSLQAAVATEAAALQGKFWYMHDMIYENQKYLTRTSFSEFAREIDLDTRLFENCREHRKLFRKVISESGMMALMILKIYTRHCKISTISKIVQWKGQPEGSDEHSDFRGRF